MIDRGLMAALAAALCLSAGWTMTVAAQALPVDPAMWERLTPEQQRQLLQSMGIQSPFEASPAQSLPVPPVVRPRAAPRDAQDHELDAANLRPFGYDLFLGEPTTFAPVTEIPVPQDYVLGPGDTVKVQLFGNENATHLLVISRDGTVNFPRLGPVNASGQTYDAFRQLIERRVGNEMIGVRANVSLGELRSMRVFVVGDANYPGSYTVSSLSTITNALVVSGGISTAGSLRNVQLKRNGRTVRRIDLYGLLLRGDSRDDVRLQPGDVILVPPVGRRVTVAGHVRRPAIYELLNETSVQQVLELAGGTRPSAAVAAAQLERFDAGSRKTLIQVDVSTADGVETGVRDGDILRLPAIPETVDIRVDVAGHVRYPGAFQWREGMRMRELLDSTQILPTTSEHELYSALALIGRTSPATGMREWRAVDLNAVLSAGHDEPLLANDRVLILTRKDVEFLSSRNVRRILLGQAVKEEQRAQRIAGAEQGGEGAGIDAQAERLDANLLKLPQGSPRSESTQPGPAQQAPPGYPGFGVPPGAAHPPQPAPRKEEQDEFERTGECAPLVELARIINSQRVDRFAALSAPLQSDVELEFKATNVCPEIFRDAPSAVPFLLEHAAAVVGEVRRPGLYPVSPNTGVAAVVALAGGLTRDSNATDIELVAFSGATESGAAQYESVNLDDATARRRQVRPGDLIRVKGSYIGQEIGVVEVRGEFRLPGRYTIVKGETLSQLIQRSGGLTPDAYPYGAVFTRESARQAEERSFERAADELQSALVTAVTSGSLRDNAASATQFVNQLIGQLRAGQAVGRVVIETEPERLAQDPELDITLEPGDKIFVPKRPKTVTVIGQVLNPGSVRFDPDLGADDYVDLAGGLSQASDDDRVFLVLPNGSARPVPNYFWSGLSSGDVPPGSAIVVPRDATPINAFVVTERITAIFRDLSLSAAALLTITDR